MGKEILRYVRLYCGFFSCALGAVLILNSDLGLSPWDVLHQGISNHTFLKIGEASIVIGVIIVLVDVLLGQPIGVGTVLNFIFVGLFVDGIIYLDFVPKPTGFVLRGVQLLIGICFMTYGTFLYMTQEMGCGPRDGFMQIITKKFNLSIGVVKNSIEVTAFVVGWLLGGKFGVGTVAAALIMGVLLQWMFKLRKIDIKSLNHRSIKEEFKHLRDVIKNKK